MGNCFSDPSTSKAKPKGKGQVLGSGPPNTANASNTTGTTGTTPGSVGGRTTRMSVAPPVALGGGASEAGMERERALAAAEERAKAASKKGVNASNPNAGKLSSKLQEERKAPRSPEPKDDTRMMDRGAYN